MADRIYIQDLRKAKYCMCGSRKLFKKFGYSWTKFLKEGISVEEVEKWKDAMADKVCEQVKNRR